MLTSITHVLALTTIRRERVLPYPGRVFVHKGDKVKPLDVIAEANAATEYLWLDLARGLGIPAERIPSTMQVRAGERASKGDILAGPVGFAKRVVRAPCSGRVVLLRNGQMLMQVDGTTLKVRAGIPGTVTTVIPEYGATIECSGALVQGVWGNGKIDLGVLRVAMSEPNSLLTPENLGIALRGAVILAGCCEDAKALEAAADLPVRGLILASISASLLPVAIQMDYPILITEGFGRLPMNSLAFNILSTNEGREVTVNAELFDRYSSARPEAIIALPVVGPATEPSQSPLLQPNRRVRVVRAPHRSRVGTFLAIRSGFTQFPNGVRARAGVVRLEDGETIIVPLANLEILE